MMMRRWLLLAAALIVCVTNVVALGLGLLNRRTATAGAITLTERELPTMSLGPESTATILRIQWTSQETEGFPCDKIRPLGFTCPNGPSTGDSREFRQPQRKGYVVLEYDGPAWEIIRKRREAEEAEFAASHPTRTPGDFWGVEHHSRLVAIDIGADPEALRRTYPDASRYLITTARIGTHQANSLSTISGFITELMPSTINVPLPFSRTIRERDAAHAAGPPKSWTPRYTVTLRYGRFLEPWIVDVQR